MDLSMDAYRVLVLLEQFGSWVDEHVLWKALDGAHKVDALKELEAAGLVERWEITDELNMETRILLSIA